jgi:hypothetical protein
MLFRPFRLGLWARLAVVALVTGEAGGVGGGWSGSIPNLRQTSGSDDHLINQWSGHGAGLASLFSELSWDPIRPYLGWIALLGVAAFLVFLLWIYSDCVYRFILLDTVVSGQCHLREGWRRWKAAGRRYFAWAFAFACGSFVLVGTVAGVPALLAYRAGWFDKPEENLGALIGCGILLVLVLIVIVALLAIIDMLGRDFLVPVMAFERVGPVDGWRKLLAMMGAEKLAYAVYVLMKAALAMGAGVVFAIVNLIVVLILLVPLGLLGLTGYFLAKAAGVGWDISAALLLAALGMLLVAGILYVIGFVYAPGLVFFQSYTLEFFAPRYGPLGSRMFAPAPPLTPTAVPAPPSAPSVPGNASLA